jgi:hypothetical protein
MKYLLYLSGFSFLFFCCKQQDKITDQDIIGTWEVYEALRNGKPTKTLEAATIQFKDDKSVLSNVLPDQAPLKYQLKDRNLLIKGNESYDLYIEQIALDTLILSGKMSIFDMELKLKRK